MPGFDPEATAPVRQPSANPRAGRRAGGRPPDAVPTPRLGRPPAATARPGRARHVRRRHVRLRHVRPAAATAAPARPRPPAGSDAVLPDVTTDERDLGWGELPEPSDDDRYLREVPPHHGG